MRFARPLQLLDLAIHLVHAQGLHLECSPILLDASLRVVNEHPKPKTLAALWRVAGWILRNIGRGFFHNHAFYARLSPSATEIGPLTTAANPLTRLSAVS